MVWVISNNRNTCTCLPRFNVSQRPKDESVSTIGATFKTCVPTNKFLLTHTTHFFPKTVFVGSQKITVQIVSRSFCKTLNVPYISLTTNQPQGILPKQWSRPLPTEIHPPSHPWVYLAKDLRPPWHDPSQIQNVAIASLEMKWTLKP